MNISTPNPITDLARLFQLGKKDFYLVGGALRDQLIGKKPQEWDAATNATPDEIITIIKKAEAKNISEVGKRFGTISAVIHGEPIEITTYRSELYAEFSRQPTVKFGHSLDEDLSRRDFTVNAIAYEPISQKIIDKFNGQADLEAKIIQSVGEPSRRFAEDPLRMIRAIRFATTLDFNISGPTLNAIAKEKERFAILSVERIRQEFDKILLVNKPSTAIELIRETGLISYILPELIPSIDIEFDPTEHKDIYHHILQVLDQTPPKLELRWCALLHDIAKPITRKKIGNEFHFIGHEIVGAKMAKTILERLKYPNAFINYVTKMVRLHQRLPNDDGSWTDGAVRRFVRDAGECLNDLFIFAEADSTGKNQRKLDRYHQKRQTLLQRITELEQQAEIAKLKSPLSGEDLMKLFNRPAGPWIKPIKEELLRQVIDGQLGENDVEKAQKIAKKLNSGNN